jgi:hypothetical protein
MYRVGRGMEMDSFPFFSLLSLGANSPLLRSGVAVRHVTDYPLSSDVGTMAEQAVSINLLRVRRVNRGADRCSFPGFQSGSTRM